jgi:hypothetical protein
MDEDANLPPEKLLEYFFLEDNLASFTPGCLLDEDMINILEGDFYSNLSNDSHLNFKNTDESTDICDKLFINFTRLEVRPTLDQIVQIISAVREILGIVGDDGEV